MAIGARVGPGQIGLDREQGIDELALRRGRQARQRIAPQLRGGGAHGLDRGLDFIGQEHALGAPVACVALHCYPDSQQAELACLFVAERFENQGIGAKLAQYAEGVARALGAEQLFCLSTQAFNFFVQKAGYRPGTPDDLPPARREKYEQHGRKSAVLVKSLAPDVPKG